MRNEAKKKPIVSRYETIGCLWVDHQILHLVLVWCNSLILLGIVGHGVA